MRRAFRIARYESAIGSHDPPTSADGPRRCAQGRRRARARGEENGESKRSEKKNECEAMSTKSIKLFLDLMVSACFISATVYFWCSFRAARLSKHINITLTDVAVGGENNSDRKRLAGSARAEVCFPAIDSRGTGALDGNSRKRQSQLGGRAHERIARVAAADRTADRFAATHCDENKLISRAEQNDRRATERKPRKSIESKINEFLLRETRDTIANNKSL